MQNLKTKTVKELRDIAKEKNITGRWEMSKEELIEAISNCDLSDDMITFENDCIIKEDDTIQSEGSQKVTKTTQDYLNDIQAGTLVAFQRSKEKGVAMSGKYIGTERGKVVVESKKGTRYNLNPENIIWVKTGTRWPKWVFSLFNNTKTKEVEVDNAIS